MKRPLTADQITVLRRILTGGHPSPGSAYLGWKQDKPNAKRLALALFAEQQDLGDQVVEIKRVRRIVRRAFIQERRAA